MVGVWVLRRLSLLKLISVGMLAEIFGEEEECLEWGGCEV